jgi:16S rRNA (cytosine967-C5)-methyltransferase
MPTNSRLTSAKILQEWFEKEFFPARKLIHVREDRAFVMEVVNGCVRRQLTLDWIMDTLMHQKPKAFIRAVIHVGLYQLFFMDHVQTYAAVNECVNASKQQAGSAGMARLVNAVLRRADRERASLLEALHKENKALQSSHPNWLMERWIEQYGVDEAHCLADWNNEPPQTILRIEQGRVDAASFIDELRKKEIEPALHPASDSEVFLVVPRGINVVDLPGFDQGNFIIQDPATVLSIDLLAPRPGEKVLDACAAPGGKTLLMAGRMKGGEGLTAMEYHTDRLPALRDNLRRLDMEQVEVVHGDARDPMPALGDRLFDAILLDVPCSNSGVLRRRCEARWRINQERIDKMALLQIAILDACSKMLRAGGRIVYSTCSLEAEENEELVHTWLAKNEDFSLDRFVKAFPPESDTDGAFAALLRRRS